MSKRMIFMVIAGVVLAVGYFVFFSKNPLEKFLDTSVKACEQENSAMILDLVSTEYLNRFGLTQDNMHEILKRLFDNFDQIKVIPSEIQTRFINDSTGELEFDFKVVATVAANNKLIQGVDTNVYGSQRMYLIGTPAKAGHMTLEMIKEGSTWKLKAVKNIDVGYPIPNYDQAQPDLNAITP